MPWVRSGTCKRGINQDGACGCCANYDPWGESHPTRANVPEVAATPRPPTRTPGYCPLFSIVRVRGQNVGNCAGHNVGDPESDRRVYLRLCEPWPRHPDDIKDFPSCQDCYSFTWVD
jgi:hypothetical protein